MLLKINSIKKDMTEDKNRNNKIVKRYKRILFNTENLHFIVGPYYEETETLLLIEAMYENGFSPNTKDYLGDNLITKSLKAPKKEEFIVSLLKLSLKYGLDVNNVYRHNQTIVHNIISSKRYYGNIIPIYNLLKEKGLNIFLVNNDWKDLETTADFSNINDLEEFKTLYKKDLEKGLNEEFNNYYNRLLYDYGLNSNSFSKGNLFKELPNLYLNEKFLLKVIERLLKDQNLLGRVGFSNIMEFINFGHSNEFIYELVKIAIESGLYINYQNNKGNTILHHIIKCDYFGNLYPIYILLMENGFDDTIKNNNNDTIYDLLKNPGSDVCDKEDIFDEYNKKRFTKKSINSIDLYNLNESDYDYLKQFEKNIEDKWLYRRIDHEYEFNKLNLISGKKGVGKSMYLINLCSRYNMREDKALYITIEDILNLCEHISDFNIHLFKIMRICGENNITLMIDDIDRIYTKNISDIKKEEINMFIDMYTRQYGLTIIGTLNNDKLEIFTNNSLMSNKIHTEYLYFPECDELLNIIKFMIGNELKFKDETTKELLIRILTTLSKVNENASNVSNVEIVKTIIEVLKNFDIIDIDQIRYSISVNKYLDKEIIKILNNELSEFTNHSNIEKIVKKLKK